MIAFFVTAVSALLLSQGIGIWVNDSIVLGTTVEINSFIHFTHIRNYGGVFGLAQGSGWLFGMFSILILFGISAYLLLANNLSRYEYICFGFVVGGGTSNIIDRLIHGGVIDFIDIQQIPHWNYVFNTADVMIHLGIWPLLIFGFLLSRNSKDT
ncbi:MAG: signal peptidase II [Gammaproteobacteria bacterium]|nr:signal peptidase II [Gammaproteobacteria bacterium]